MEETLKERFEQILQENGNSIMWNNAAKELIFKNMLSVHNMALSDSKQLRYDYEAAVLRISELEKECELLKDSVASLHSELHEAANNPNYLYQPLPEPPKIK